MIEKVKAIGKSEIRSNDVKDPIIVPFPLLLLVFRAYGSGAGAIDNLRCT